MNWILTGLGRGFDSVPIFTDCAMPPGQVLIGAAIIDVLAGNRGLPHTCSEDKRCSRWVMETEHE